MLLPFQPKRTRFADILQAIKAQIIARAVVGAAMVQIVARDDPPNTKAQKLIYLRARRHMAQQEEIQSAGRLDTRLVRQVDIYISNQVSLDPINSDEVWLTDAARGMFDLEEDVVNALQNWTPTDADGNELTIQDIRLLSGAQADKDSQRQLLGWGRANCTFEVVYHPPLSLADITPSTIPAATAGTAYTQAFTQVGSEGMCVVVTPLWTAPNLPPGLTVSGATGIITGTPTTAGRYQFKLTVTDADNKLAGWHRYVLPVNIGISGALPGGTVGVPYLQTLAAVGNTGAVTWSIQLNSGAFGGVLPPGLIIDPVLGVVSGIPTTAGAYPFTVQAIDGKGNPGLQTFAIVVV